MRKAGLVVGAAVLLFGCGWHGEPAGPTEHEHHVVELDNATQARVQLKMGAGELDVTGGSHRLLDGDFDYNVPAWKPTVTYQAAGTEGTLDIAQGSNSSSGVNTKNHWQLALNDTRPIDLTAHVGAGEARLTLGTLNLRHVDIQMGAGELNLDLRGAPKTSYDVSVNGGVGSATIHVPSSVGISATASGGLGDITVTGLDQRDGRWINPRAASSPVTITLNVHGGVGEIKIIAD